VRVTSKTRHRLIEFFLSSIFSADYILRIAPHNNIVRIIITASNYRKTLTTSYCYFTVVQSKREPFSESTRPRAKTNFSTIDFSRFLPFFFRGSVTKHEKSTRFQSLCPAHLSPRTASQSRREYRSDLNFRPGQTSEKFSPSVRAGTNLFTPVLARRKRLLRVTTRARSLTGSRRRFLVRPLRTCARILAVFDYERRPARDLRSFA